MPLAFVDGTFEADARSIWSRAYAYGRPDWDADKVAKLLDEFERVGLLQRTKDEDGRVWGFWVGSDKFLPAPAHRERYKAGKRALFGEIKDTSLTPQGAVLDASKSLPLGFGVGSGVEVGVRERERGKGLVLVLGSAAKDPENEPQPQDQNPTPLSSSPTPKATATAEATPTPLPFKRIRTAILSPAERRATEDAIVPASISQDPLKPSPWHLEHGYELCSDDIWRSMVDRSSNGWIVKGEDHRWLKKESK
jgi:hypothetical protein